MPVRVVVLAGVSQVATGNQYDLAIGSYNYTTVPSLTGDTTAQASQALNAVDANRCHRGHAAGKLGLGGSWTADRVKRGVV